MVNITFIGNYFVDKIPEFRNPNIEKFLEIKGISPFSIACGKKLEKYENKVLELGEKVDVRKCLGEMLSDKPSQEFRELARRGGRSYLDVNDSDYIVLDNTACIYDLINIENKSFYTCSKHSTVTDNEYYTLNEREKKQRLIEPYKNPMFDWRYYFDFFISLIKERFSKEKIILISSSHLQCYLEEGELKRYSDEDIRKILFLNEVDQYFISKTECKVINLLDEYLTIGYEKWKFPPARIEAEIGFKIREEIEEIVLENKYCNQGQYLKELLVNYDSWKATINEEEKGKYFENSILQKYRERQNLFRNKNIEKLNSSGYCYIDNNENEYSSKLFIPLSSEWYLMVDSKNLSMDIIKCNQDFELSKLKEDEFQCKISQISKMLSAYQVYIEKARMGYGEKAFVINLTEQEFKESLCWLDYTFLLDNENVIFNFTDNFKDCTTNTLGINCRVNLEFLFDKNTRIVRLGDGLGDQISLYFFAKTIEKQNKCNVYFDDTVYTYRRIFNGLEIQKIIKEDISSKLITNNLSNALIDRLQNCRYTKQYDYRLPYMLFKEGLKELVFIYMPTKDKIRNEFPGNKISLTPFNQEVRFFSNLADINFGIPYFSIIYRPPKVLIKNKNYWNSLMEFDDLDDKNKKIACEIQSTDSVALHIRRGDFETQGRILNSEIYAKAVNKVKNIAEYENKKFYIFSDDINWCSNNIESLGLEKGDNITFISHNVGDNSWKDMVLMSYAKIMIVANSGFSLNAFIANKNIETLYGAYDFEKAGWKNKYLVVQEIRSSSTAEVLIAANEIQIKEKEKSVIQNDLPPKS